MALGTRKQRIRQETLWIAKQELPASAAHPFYTRLNELLDAEKFDEFAEAACKQFYAKKLGRPSLTPGIYFRALLVGISRASIPNAVSPGGPPTRSASATFWESDSTNAVPIIPPSRAPAG